MRFQTLLLLAVPALAQFGPASSQGANLAPSPTNSIGCRQVDGRWECAAERTATPTTAQPTIPSPTNSGHCHWHISHWDCEGENGEGADDAHGECIIHVGHTHGDCSHEQLACGRILMENYDMPLHIGSIFIILVTSAVGVMIPLLAGWTKSGGKKTNSLDAGSFGKGVGLFGNILFIARHFGTGIILSTAFIHLLYHGFVMFNNECIGHMGYEATAPAISLASAMVTFMFDFLGSRSSHSRMQRRSSELSTPTDSPRPEDREKNVLPDDEDHNHAGHSCVSHADEIFREEQDWQVILLEAGIIFHSIMIGVTLGAGSGPGWVTLLIVLVFHQFFEGAALGARIALLFWISKFRALVMGLAFILITPIGVAIGIGVRKSFSQNGKAALLSVGILNSISAGILVYTAFRLIIADFIDGPVRRARWSAVLVAFISMTVGLIAMSVLGKWA